VVAVTESGIGCPGRNFSFVWRCAIASLTSFS
jgi:hypothetical protein